MATLEQLQDGLRKAHAAGNADHARAFANAIRQMQGSPQPSGNGGVVRTPQQWADAENLPIPGTEWNTPEQPARFQSPIPGGDFMNEISRSFAENVPVVGPLVDRGAQAAGSQIAAMITGRTPEEEQADRDRLRAADMREQPIANAAGTVAGAVGPLMSLGQTKLGAQALGLQGPLHQRMAAGGLSGGIIAGADALARGDDPLDAAQTGAMGIGLGAAFPLAERFINPISRMLLGGYNPPAAVSKVAQSLDDARIDPTDLPRILDDLGPDGMLLDVNPNLTRQGGAIAATPGQGQTVLTDAMTARQQGANARIQGDIDATLGPATSPRQFNQGIRDAQRALSPQYEAAFANAAPVEVGSIAARLDGLSNTAVGEIGSAVSRVRGMLTDPQTGTLTADPRRLMAIRQELDDMIGGAQGNLKRVLSDVRASVDEELGRAVPGIKEVDQQFASLAKQREGFEQGQQALDSGRLAMTPADLERATATMADEVVAAMSQGARAEIDRIIGTTANNVTALKTALKGDGSWNRDRLVTLFGSEKADKLLNVLEREQTFANSYNRIMGNSETAARQAAQKDLGPREFDFDWQKLLFGIPQQMANAAARGRSNSVNAQIAEMLTGRASPELVDRLIAARNANRGVIGAAPVPLLTSQ